MNLKGKKLLVTGADGFIGSHLTEELIEKGYDVRAFIYYNSFNSWGWLEHAPKEIKKDIEIFSGDIRDSYGVKEAMKGCDVVFHLAALISIPYSYHSPNSYIDTNITGTLNILQAAEALSVKKVIHTSTSEVYGTAQYVPISEEHPLQGQSPYAASKIGADQLALSFYNTFSTPVSIIRPFNTYGPRQSARAVIPTIITQIAEGKRKIQLGSLKPTRDFNYIRDTVRGFIEVAKSDATIGEVINIGSDFEVSIEETVKTIAEVMEVEVEIETDTKRIRPEKSEVNRLWADISKARRLFDWKPIYGGRNGFKQGLQETVSWFRHPQHLKMYKGDRYNL
ncbi:NAD-dependent 4,6-dehydratase LegB [Clostridium formicaceticum]|uniref:NAD-dependent dehydratase n=1 Tax=Clostridium formicaceticum TaxID=1497 RepID=A0AAC9RKK5_9CLOT|nr:NAD-dependent 4,6-dehydratase LegB [Clostridium formicaceticum]AOY78164.1 NAD-dependent dehydratase [Clostridium formicaceticum]ARE88819.1 dTDP-glucose 4,6-dehydratase [Clostridium formicaceticum]